MLEAYQRTALSDRYALPASMPATQDPHLLADWREGLAILNLRGPGDDPGFRAAVGYAISLELPGAAPSTSARQQLRVIRTGPDEWFLIGQAPSTHVLGDALRMALTGLHHAVTDVSGGYVVMNLAGPAAREVLAAGCPLDLHPRAFGPGSSAASHYFKAPIVMWQTDTLPSFEVMVRSSLAGYFRLMLERSSRECGLVTRRSA